MVKINQIVIFFYWSDKMKRLNFKKMVLQILIFIVSFCFTSRGIVCMAEPAQDSKVSTNKVIYLTFDDGPGYKVTNELLDILKENNVKATFFVIGQSCLYRPEVVKRIYSDGHTLGIHTFTHKNSIIYRSDDNFMNEVSKTAKLINALTGFEPTAVRFPEGSRGHLTHKLLDRLHENNYKVYDWNVPLSDGINPKIQPWKLYKQGINMRYHTSPIFLLAHCSNLNKNTCCAIPNIIKYYKNLGYEFKPITKDTEEYYFKIKR